MGFLGKKRHSPNASFISLLNPVFQCEAAFLYSDSVCLLLITFKYRSEGTRARALFTLTSVCFVLGYLIVASLCTNLETAYSTEKKAISLQQVLQKPFSVGLQFNCHFTNIHKNLDVKPLLQFLPLNTRTDSCTAPQQMIHVVFLSK